MRRRASSPVFVGRDRELGDLGDALERAMDGRPTVALLGGEAGVGKTRLVEEFVARAAAREATIARGGCIELGDLSLPFAPIVEVIRSLVRTYDPATLARVLGPARAEAEKLVPDLATALEGIERTTDEASARIAEGLDSADPAARSIRLELLLGVVRRLGSRSAFVVVLEDLQWADPSTLDLVAYLTRNLTTEHLVLVGTYRTDAIPPGHPLRHLAVELARDPRVERYEVAPLAADDLVALVRAILGREPDPALEARVVGRSDGNPFFAEELLAAELDAVDRPIPTELRELILDRIRRMSGPAAEVTRIVAVAGRAADDATLSTVSGLDPIGVEAAVRDCVEDQVLVPARDGVYTFRHALVGEAVAEDILPGEKRRLHEAIAVARAAIPLPAGPARAPEAAERARHWAAAGRPDQAFGALLVAARAAVEIGGYAEAAEELDRALGLWDLVPEPVDVAGGDRADLLDRAAEAWALAGETERALDRGQAAAEAVDPVADPLRAGALRTRLASYHLELDHDAAALDLLDAALGLLGDDPAGAVERYRALVGRGCTLMLLGRLTESAEACRTALLVDPGEPGPVAAQARTYLGVDLVSLGHAEEGLSELRTARRIAAASTGSPVTSLDTDRRYAAMLDRADRLDEAAAEALAAAARADAIGLGRRSAVALRAVAARALIRRGRWVEAEGILDACRALAPRGSSGVAVHGAGAVLEIGRGQADRAHEDLASARSMAGANSRPDTEPALATAEAELAILERRWDDAVATVDGGLERLAGVEDRYWVAPLAALGIRAEADRTEAIRARRATIGLAESRASAERLRTVSGSAIREGADASATSRAYAALVAAEWTRFDEDPGPGAWAAAATAFEGIPDPHRASYCRFREAEAILASKGSRGDATAACRAAVVAASELGAEPLRAAAVALAQRARLDLAVAEIAEVVVGRPSPATSLGLTPRELEILAIVARGRTNRQIAAELFITEKTVGVHMTNILAKLGVTNRIDAGAVAERLGIVRDSTGGRSPVTPTLGQAGGASVPARHPRARRAFLFTDIVGSTALIGVIGDDAWADLRRWHDVRLRAMFTAHHGEELDHAGDGFLVSFERTGDAIDCAIDIQRALAEHRRQEGFAPSVRIGIHTSEAVRDGSGFTGRAIHEGARIAALAGPDEIVASVEALHDAPPRQPTPDTRMVSLKGIADPVAVATVSWRST